MGKGKKKEKNISSLLDRANTRTLLLSEESGGEVGESVGARGGRVGARGGRVGARGGRVGARGGRVGARGGRVGARGGKVGARGGRSKGTGKEQEEEQPQEQHEELPQEEEEEEDGEEEEENGEEEEEQEEDEAENSDDDDSDDEDHENEEEEEQDGSAENLEDTPHKEKRERQTQRFKKPQRLMITKRLKKLGKHIVGTVGNNNNSEDSCGDKVRADRIVMRTRKENIGKEANVNCRVDNFGKQLEQFTPRQLEIVEEMGFGSLVHLIGRSLPRNLCYWLMTRVDPVDRIFLGPNNEQFPLSTKQVRWVLGLRNKGKEVPMHITDDDMKAETDRLVAEIGIKPTGYEAIFKEGREEKDGSTKIMTPEEEDKFRQTFLMYALATILAPTTNTNLASHLLPASSVWKEASKYNWCAFVLDMLMCEATSFLARFNENGFAKGAGGCSYFLAIFYLDRLNRRPLHWDNERGFPRIKVWSKDDVSCAWHEDLNRADGDFGNLGVVKAVYGEPHPRDAADTDGPEDTVEERFANKIAKNVVRIILPLMRNGVDDVELSSGNNNVDLSRLISQSNVSGTRKRKRQPTPDDPKEVNGASQGSAQNITGFRHSGGSLGGRDYETARSRSNFSLSLPHIGSSVERRENEVTSVVIVNSRPNLRNRSQQLTDLISYLKDWSSEGQQDVALIKCAGMEVLRSHCAAAVKSGHELPPEYISLASALYTRTWRMRFKGYNYRLLLDYQSPENLKDADEILGCQAVKDLVDLNPIKIGSVFIPIYENKRWWCAAVCLSLRVIKIIDPMKKPVEDKTDVLDKIVHVLDEVFHKLDNSWTKGVVSSWKRMSIVMKNDCDSETSGIIMLLAIKECARETLSSVFVESVNVSREWLVFDDVFSQFNESNEKKNFTKN